MRLSYLLKGVEVLNDFSDREIFDVTNTTERVKNGCAFVCVKGNTVDGHELYLQALRCGAAAVITERNLYCPEQVIVRDTKKAYALMCKGFFENAGDTIHTVGVTGTNGKTSVSYIIKSILEALGERCSAVGTLGAVADGENIPCAYTTPCAYEIHRIFKLLKDKGIDYCVSEASSQALSQERLYGISFDVGVFTNLTRDHLDYHKSFENYRESKKKLLFSCKTAVLNGDDENAAFMANGLKCKIITYGKNGNNMLRAENIALFGDGAEFTVNGEKARINIPGEFSVYNALAAVAAVSALGFDLKSAVAALEKAKPVRGRLERINTNTDFNVIIDFAHTEDGIKQVLSAARSFTDGKIITVFGCGGNRDSGKRSFMGETAARLSETVIITSDNPRFEEPYGIMEQIYKGASGNCERIALIAERRTAIALALRHAKKGDTVMLLGKGHEQYQIVGNKKIRFDERETVNSLLKKGV